MKYSRNATRLGPHLHLNNPNLGRFLFRAFPESIDKAGESWEKIDLHSLCIALGFSNLKMLWIIRCWGGVGRKGW